MSGTPRAVLLGTTDELAAWLARALPGIDVRTASDAAEAESLLRSENSVLVVDYGVGVDECTRVLRWIASAKEEGARPAILILGTDVNAEAVAALVAGGGVKQLLLHPLDREELCHHVATALGREVHPRSTSAAPDSAAAVHTVFTRFLGAIQARVKALESAVEAASRDQLGEALRAEARREAHKLAGSLGTFGLTEGTRIAREVEAHFASESTLDVSALRSFVGQLGQLIADAAGADSDLPLQLLITTADTELGVALVTAAAERGVRGRRFRAGDLSDAEVAELAPQAAVLDLSSETDAAASRMMLRVLTELHPPVPVVAVTAADRLMDRVDAARAGATVVLARPLSPDRVLSEVDLLLRRGEQQHFRVLLVDDDPGVLSLMEALLQREGMLVTTLADPLQFWETLDACAPDLLVLDVDMPELDGVELCQVVRADSRWVSLPVLFLTARTDAETVRRVFAAGADDYLTKPVMAPELVTRIKNRLERLQLLRTLADIDALTGLTNRRKAEESLDQLRRLALRQNVPLSVGLLDVDGFKAVNDRYGHAAGDDVLRHLAQELRRCFRGEDVVGRWGGEEFVLGMFDMPADAAARRLGELLEEFSLQRFAHAEGDFRVSFSAGIAEFPRQGREVHDLVHAADLALYRAKESGRGRVIIADD